MDPEFQHILFRVILVGGGIFAIGAVTLFFAFRSFAGPQGKGRDFRAVVLIASVLVFVMIACLLLLKLSMR